MKVFFASLTDLTVEVDAWVPSVEQGLILFTALAELYPDHAVVMRGRVKLYHDYEERYIGAAKECDGFLGRIASIGNREPTQPSEGDVS